MSRLDQHVAAVRNKLGLARFVNALVWAMLIFAAAVTIDIIIARTFQVQLPHPRAWFWSGAGLAVLGALAWGIRNRPSTKAAAVAIDEKLGLREKISTALFVRDSSDPFARAAVRDAEQTAEKVVLNYYQHFPLRRPRGIYPMLAMFLIAGLVGWRYPRLDLFEREAQAKTLAKQENQRAQAEATIKQAIATVEAIPKTMRDDEAIKKAQIELNNLLKNPIKDPAAASRSALKALEEAKEAVKRQAEQNAKFAEAKNIMKDLARNVAPANDEKGPISEAKRKIAEGKFTEAFNQLDEVVKKFDQMDDQQKQQVAQQMQQMANQLQQAAGNPQQQQQAIAKQLQQQLGMNQQQAQQMAQQMQQAAQGDQQAQQQLQQQMQQMMQQMNNGQGPTAAQQQQIQQAMQQIQAQTNSQAAAGQMAQAAQQMAQAMQQAAQGQNNAQGQQQMAQGMGQMAQQLQDLEAIANDLQQTAAAQQQLQQAADAAAGACQGGGAEGNPGGELAGRKDGANPWAAGDPEGKFGNGMGGPGIGAGGRGPKNASPYATTPEMSPSPDNQKGRILASNFIKDNQPITGQSKEELKAVVEAAQKEGADEVENERISNHARSTVKKYFQAITDEAR